MSCCCSGNGSGPGGPNGPAPPSPPIFARGGARLSDVLERFWAGDDLGTVAEEFGVPVAELEDVLRVASRRAA